MGGLILTIVIDRRTVILLSYMCVYIIQEECYQYWPSDRSARYQYFVVDPLAEYNMPQYVLREFKVTDARVSLHVKHISLSTYFRWLSK